MKILLFNDNPVVTKLVTLSAQKTGDELEVCPSIEALNPGKFDLLIVDDALYSDDNALELATSISAKQHLLMANRGTKEPEGFEHYINKPFLPTDLVELFSTISASLDAQGSEDIEDEPDMIISMDDEILDLGEDLDNEVTLEDDDDNDSEMDLDLGENDLDDLELGGLDLDDLEANDDMLLDLDLEKTADIDLSTEELLEDDSEESVLDKDDLAEVQGLLEDTESEDSEEIIEDDSEMDLDFSETMEDLENIEIDDDDDDTLENIEIDDDNDTLEFDEELSDIDKDEVLDGEALDTLEDEIETAVLGLSDEELEEDIDEETLLDIVSSNETLANFTGLDDLDEQSLKVAVGEAEASDFETPDLLNSAEDTYEKQEVDTVPDSIKTDNKSEGAEALKTLLKALENDDVAKSLKGMNITINISFGGDN